MSCWPWEDWCASKRVGRIGVLQQGASHGRMNPLTCFWLWELVGFNEGIAVGESVNEVLAVGESVALDKGLSIGQTTDSSARSNMGGGAQ